MDQKERNALIMAALDDVLLAVETMQINMERQNIGLARDHAEIAQHKIEDVLLLISEVE
jgi:hypothetical protein